MCLSFTYIFIKTQSPANYRFCLETTWSCFRSAYMLSQQSELELPRGRGSDAFSCSPCLEPKARACAHTHTSQAPWPCRCKWEFPKGLWVMWRLCNTQGSRVKKVLKFQLINWTKALRLIFLRWSFEVQGDFVWIFLQGLKKRGQKKSCLELYSIHLEKVTSGFLQDFRWCGSEIRNVAWYPHWAVQVSVQQTIQCETKTTVKPWKLHKVKLSSSSQFLFRAPWLQEKSIRKEGAELLKASAYITEGHVLDRLLVMTIPHDNH